MPSYTFGVRVVIEVPVQVEAKDLNDAVALAMEKARAQIVPKGAVRDILAVRLGTVDGVPAGPVARANANSYMYHLEALRRDREVLEPAPIQLTEVKTSTDKESGNEDL